MGEKLVLVVEDEETLSGLFLNMLEAFNLTGYSASSGEVALELLKERQYEFLIVDLTLPKISGLDLYKEIVAAKPEYRGKVVFTSGYNVNDELETLMASDNIAFLHKPFSLKDFQSVLSAWL